MNPTPLSLELADKLTLVNEAIEPLHDAAKGWRARLLQEGWSADHAEAIAAQMFIATFQATMTG